MAAILAPDTASSGPLEHPAVQAWSRVGPARVAPAAIEILKQKNKSAIYRLLGAGQGGSAVVAKRCLATTARVERLVYEKILSSLPVPALRCLGYLEEPGSEFCWLFLEDAGALQFSTSRAEHRALAGQWLGKIHSVVLDAPLAAQLPVRSPDYYLARLQEVRRILSEHFGNPALRADDLRLLQSLGFQCQVLEAHWQEIVGWCRGMPQTLVHGDFVVKNVHVRDRSAGRELLAFDWELAGFGIPATDLAQFTGRTVSPDLQVYWETVQWSGAPPDAASVQQLAVCGRFFRLIDDLAWASSILVHESYEWLIRPLCMLQSYRDWLGQTLSAVGWTK